MQDAVHISGMRDSGHTMPAVFALAIMALLLGLTFEIAIAAAIGRSTLLQGYPVPTSKKKRACVVTYRHSEDRWFENSISPRSNVNDL
jgi:hypothetical protein